MKVSELIELLEDIATEHGDTTEVRIAHQPSWPFELSIGAVIAGTEYDEFDAADGQAVAYVAEGSQIGYLPGYVKHMLDW